MNERDELARLLMSDEIMNVPDIGGFDYALHEADVILAAGYSKPRTITTAEELDALAVGSVILDPIGLALRRDILGWNCTNGTTHIDNDVLVDDALPATVLWEPK